MEIPLVYHHQRCRHWNTEIKNWIKQSLKVIGWLSSIWWNNNMSQSNKRYSGKSLVGFILCYGSEIQKVNAEMWRRINDVEIDYLRRSAGVSRVKKIMLVNLEKNESNRNCHRSARKKMLKWFGLSIRMNKNRRTWIIYKWKWPWENKYGRPKRS